MRRNLVCVICGLLAWFSFVCTASADNTGHETLRIGSKRFTESYILAQVVAQTAAPHLTRAPEVLQGLGNTAIVYQALRSGAIDVYPEYAGTIAQEILKSSHQLSMEEMNQALAPLGLVVSVPFGFNDGYALAMRESDAKRLNIRSLSDLHTQPTLKFGLSNEFIGRADGWRGLAERYGLQQTPTAIDHGLAYAAIGSGEIDVIDIYTTDAKIAQLGLRVLRDDQNYFPRYDALLLARADVGQRFPAAWAAVHGLQGSIDEASMIRMNASAELDGLGFDVIARRHLATGSHGEQAAASAKRKLWDKLWADDVWRLGRQHVILVTISVLLATLLAVPLAVLVFPYPRLRSVVLAVTGVLQTIPSLALLALLISLLGVIGTLPAMIALGLYALLPILRNTVTGLNAISTGMRDAAMALGLRPWQRMRYIELPLAAPSIVAGIRTATAIAIGTATIAAFIGAGGFGERIVTGLALNDNELLIAGALPAASLALVSEAAFDLLALVMRRRFKL